MVAPCWRWLVLSGAALALSVRLVSVPLAVAADPKRQSREIPNTAIFGVEELEETTHAEAFGALLYMADPIEPFNRVSLTVTKPAIDWFLVPVAKAYRAVVPSPVRQSLDRFSYNLTYPGRLVSLLLQGELRKSAVETARFATNTTVGVGGLFDPASRYGMPTYADDVGKAFARWGIGPGFYLFLPFLGPSSARDTVGRVFDTALNPLVIAGFVFGLPPGLSSPLSLNAFSFRIDGYETLAAAFPNLYLPVRALWSIQRQIEVENFTIPARAYARADPEPSLGVLLLTLQDEEFPQRSRTHSVHVPTTGRELPYSVWLQEEPAPLLFLIPGLGAHRLSRLAVALAELAFSRGYSVAVVSNPFHPEFISRALSGDYPGYTPSDAEDLYAVLSGMWQDLRDEYGVRMTSAALMGYSLGGIETLFIAAAQERRSARELRFERFVAVNPPVDLDYAAAQFDAYFDAPLSWPRKERARRIRALAMKAFVVMRDGVPEDGVLPFDRLESNFLVGFSGRMIIADALTAIEGRGAAGLDSHVPADGRTDALVRSILRSSFARYLSDLAVPYFAARAGGHPETVIEAAGLRAHTGALRRQAGVRVVTNADDFILGSAGADWLRDELGDRLIMFPTGGHLGNIYRPEVQGAIADALSGSTARTLGVRPLAATAALPPPGG